MKHRKPRACRLGIHQEFGDNVGTNVGTEAAPLYMFTRYMTCNRCGNRRRP